MGKFVKSLPSIISFILFLFDKISRIISFAGDVDFIIERTKNLGWINTLINFLFSPSGQILLLIFGFVWLIIIFKPPVIFQIFKKNKINPLQIENEILDHKGEEEGIGVYGGIWHTYRIKIKNNLSKNISNVTVKLVKIYSEKDKREALKSQIPLTLPYTELGNIPKTFSGKEISLVDLCSYKKHTLINECRIGRKDGAKIYIHDTPHILEVNIFSPDIIQTISKKFKIEGLIIDGQRDISISVINL